MGEDSGTAAISLSVGGKNVSIKGVVGVLGAIILVLMAAVAYLGFFSLSKWGTPIDLSASFNTQRASFERHELLTGEQHRTYRDSIDELTFVISKCLEKKKDNDCPDVSMPESLRHKLRH